MSFESREDRPSELLKSEHVDPQSMAIALVKTMFYGEHAFAEPYVVWFANTLKNWKALVSTNVRDDRYYEVTHNGEMNETYVDEYIKLTNSVYDDRIGRVQTTVMHQAL